MSIEPVGVPEQRRQWPRLSEKSAPITRRSQVHGRRWCAVIAVVAGIAGAGCSAAGHAGAAAGASSGSSRAAPQGSSVPVHTQWTTARGDGAVVAVEARTGRRVWRTPVPMAAISAPVTGRGLVVVAGTRDCNDPHLTVVAVDAKTGRPAWRRSVPTDNPCLGATPPVPLLAGHVVVAGGPNPGEGGAHPGTACNHPVAARLRATGLELATGRPRWQEPTAAGAVLAASRRIVIAAGTSPGCLVGLNPANGRIRWTVAPAVLPTAPWDLGISGNTAVGEEEGLNVSSELRVIALDCGTGQTRWTVSLPAGEGPAPMAVGDVVAVTFGAGFPPQVAVLDPATGRRLWQYTDDSDYGPTIGPGIVLSWHKQARTIVVESRDPRTGVRRWASSEIGYSGWTSVTDGATIITYPDRGVRGSAAADGHRLWTTRGPYLGAAVTTDRVYLAHQGTPKNVPQGGD
jgi:outer membrane protein assembly factor BamB